MTISIAFFSGLNKSQCVAWELRNVSGTRFAEFDFLIEAFEFAPKFVLHEFKKGIEACVHHKRKSNVPVAAK